MEDVSILRSMWLFYSSVICANPRVQPFLRADASAACFYILFGVLVVETSFSLIISKIVYFASFHFLRKRDQIFNCGRRTEVLFIDVCNSV